MWVFPQAGESPHTVITSFPQRSNRMGQEKEKKKKKKVLTSLVSNILSRCRERPVKTAYDLADVISSVCSRIYFDTTSERHQCLQFSEIFNMSIRKIVRVYIGDHDPVVLISDRPSKKFVSSTPSRAVSANPSRAKHPTTIWTSNPISTYSVKSKI
jgi:hypothetical protein